MRQQWLKIIFFGVFSITVLGATLVLWPFKSALVSVYGVSFNPDHARYLGLDAMETYRTIIREWGFKHVRLPAQWNTIEAVAGVYDFSELDTLMEIAGQEGVKVMLVIGQKTPRWPECHLPKWIQPGDDAYTSKLQAYMRAVVERYKNNPALEMWQVENEPFLKFGECPDITQQDLEEEIALVKSSDPDHKIVVTDSGELHFWQTTARVGDYFGSTLYRIVWNKYLGYTEYSLLPANWYRFKLWLAGRSPATAFIIELQAEPWIPDKPLTQVTVEERSKSLDLAQLKKNIAFADKVGFARTYFWGAEWWYWEAKQGRGEIAEYIKGLKKE